MKSLNFRNLPQNFLFLPTTQSTVRRQFEFPAAQYFVNSQLKHNKTSVFLHKTKEKVWFEARVKQNVWKKFNVKENSTHFKWKYLIRFKVDIWIDRQKWLSWRIQFFPLQVETKGKIFVQEVGTGPKICEIFRRKFDHDLYGHINPFF